MTALEAHAKLLASLPSRIHRWEPVAVHSQGRPPADHTRRLNAVIVDLHGRGLSRREIAEKLGIGILAVQRHIRKEQKCL